MGSDQFLDFQKYCKMDRVGKYIYMMHIVKHERK